MTTGTVTVSRHIDGTFEVDLDPPDARTFLVSAEIFPMLVGAIRTSPIVLDLVREGERAHVKHGDTSMRSQPWHHDRRVSILAEELGEVARVLNDLDHGRYGEGQAARLAREELVQLGAMVLDWITKIDEAKS